METPIAHKMTAHNELVPDDDPRIAFFDRLATQWDESEQDPAATIGRLEQLVGLLDLRPGECLLEVGFGTGQLTAWLAERVQPGRVVAIDFSPKMLQKASSKGIAAEFRLADVCQDDLGRAEFDVALCFHSFPHFRDQSAALRNLARSLKPQDRLIVMHLRSRADVNAFHQSVGGAIATDLLPDDNQWEGWLDMAGLKKQKMIDGPGLFFLWADLCPNE
jgi:demethylmenaquinone methyltransferase/2-methoxy-6-polyprenyl-1,4-benzoquinol methylase